MVEWKCDTGLRGGLATRNDDVVRLFQELRLLKKSRLAGDAARQINSTRKERPIMTAAALNYMLYLLAAKLQPLNRPDEGKKK